MIDNKAIITKRKYSKCKSCSKTIDVTHDDEKYLCNRCYEKECKEMENCTKEDWLKVFDKRKWTLYRPFRYLECPDGCDSTGFRYDVIFILDEYGIEAEAEGRDHPICLDCGSEAIVDKYSNQ